MRLDYLDFDADFSTPRALTAYDELPLWSAMFGLVLLDEVPLADVRTVLDVGCGTGFPLIEIAERLGPDTRVHGIDPWTGGLARAAEKIAARELRNVTLHEGTAAAMPFGVGTFDLIVSNLGINNFDDPLRAMRECRRVLRPGGRIALTTNLQGHMKELYEVFGAVLRRHGPDAGERLNAHVAHRATVDSVKELLAHSGFRVSRVLVDERRMRFRDGTALLNHHFIKLGFLPAWKEVAGGSQAVFGELEERLNEAAASAGELRLTIPLAYVEATTA